MYKTQDKLLQVSSGVQIRQQTNRFFVILRHIKMIWECMTDPNPQC